MTRSKEILESRLSTLYRLRNTHTEHVQSALRSSAPDAVKASIRFRATEWESRWGTVHSKALELWKKVTP